MYFIFFLNFSEDFSQISLENQVCLYNSYRNLINGTENINLNSRCSKIPYTLNTNCFANKYNSCRSHNLNRESDKLCEQKSMNECIIENRPVI